MSTQILDGNIQLPGYKMASSSVAAATTLSVYQSGRIINVTPGAGYTITLPVAATSAGVYYRIQMAANPATAPLVVKPALANNLKGVCLSPTGGVTSGGNTQLNFIQAVSTAGDYAIVTCDGLNWSVLAVSRVNVGVTLT